MSPLDPLEILQVIGYSIGALLPLWMLFQLVTHRSKLTNIERILGGSRSRWAAGTRATSSSRFTVFSISVPTPGPRLLRLADTVAVVSITFAYSFLLHVHLHLWANAHGRRSTRANDCAFISLTFRRSFCSSPCRSSGPAITRRCSRSFRSS
jgi:hypothetical protein